MKWLCSVEEDGKVCRKPAKYWKSPKYYCDRHWSIKLGFKPKEKRGVS